MVTNRCWACTGAGAPAMASGRPAATRTNAAMPRLPRLGLSMVPSVSVISSGQDGAGVHARGDAKPEQPDHAGRVRDQGRAVVLERWVEQRHMGHETNLSRQGARAR